MTRQEIYERMLVQRNQMIGQAGAQPYVSSPTPSTSQVLTISLTDEGVIEFNINTFYNEEQEDTITYYNNELEYVYDSENETITDSLKLNLVKILYHKINAEIKKEQDLVKILYHKINAEIKKEQEIIDNKKSKMKGFSKFLRLDKLSRILGDKE